MKILALEDQPVAAMLLMAVLRSLGHEAELVTDGATAWTKLEAGGYRVVVSDWRMPGIDGLDFCRMIRKRGGDYVYFILISSQKITKENRQLALNAGVDDFLMKPVDPEELGMRLHVAERIIGLAAQVRQLESFIPICSYCKKIRDDKKYWQSIEAYFSEQQGRPVQPRRMSGVPRPSDCSPAQGIGPRGNVVSRGQATLATLGDAREVT